MTRSTRITLVALVAVLAASTLVLYRRSRALPAAGSPRYEEVVRRFYRGLAELQVGLLDSAKAEFRAAADIVPREPASWANLAIAELRLGELEAAAEALARAAALAPASSDVAFIEGQLEKSRGRVDEAIRRFEHAIDLDPRHVQARYALAQQLESAGGREEDAERQLDALHRLRPDNVAVVVDQARLAAKRGDPERLAAAVRALAPHANRWPPLVVEQYRGLEEAARRRSGPDAVRATAYLRNVLVRVPAFREDLAELMPPSELIAEPFDRFMRLAPPSADPSPPDRSLAYDTAAMGGAPQAPTTAVVPVWLNGSEAPALFALTDRDVRRIDPAAPTNAPLLGGVAPPTARGLAALDWNRDFKTDLALAGPAGVRLLAQSDGGAFVEAPAPAAPPATPASGVWAADLEMDGDLDLIVGIDEGAPIALRNNGDGTWSRVAPFAGVIGLRGFAWADLDGDGDPDAVLLDSAGRLHAFENRQAGEFVEWPAPRAAADVRALAAGDVDADGIVDVVVLAGDGTVHRLSRGRGAWEDRTLAAWPEAATGPGGSRSSSALPPGKPAAGDDRIFLADLDNNGALDVLASSAGRTRIWLGAGDGRFEPLGAPLDVDVTGVADLNGDGLADLVGIAAGRPVRLLGRSRAGYHWQIVRPRAQPTAGDQRINSFGIGGDIEIRSGLLTEKQVIASPVVHFGLGARTAVDVTRIVWPNGVMQADFDQAADRTIPTEQRLKGSCPWVFADDGRGMRFVTDFLWRSPLGLKINAQDTAGVAQTEDWVKIRGDQLAARRGRYDVRITAELWETHFIDFVALAAVDHPVGTEVFVDERFSAAAPPRLQVRPTTVPRPIAGAWDEAGRDVTALVSRRDGRYLDTFPLGPYQGIAAEHFVEIDLGREVAPGSRLRLIANGWVYPTDSSINVAIGQGRAVRPRGVSLEAQDRAGRWIVVSPDLGFPAGKNKTMVIDLGEAAGAGAAGARRVRLRTNLEVYWDWLAVADELDQDRIRTWRIRPDEAELRYRGFSATDHADRRRPEIPIYDRVANVAPRWRDLTGYYTRFGDVRELVAAVDDRYVIMNAGDELRLAFPAPAPPAAGWTRDFVLIGDGWEKDGDYNTSFSSTVGPLPSHARPRYESSPSVALEQDPVFLAHRADWDTYHTRFVAPDRFLRGLRAMGSQRLPAQ